MRHAVTVTLAGLALATAVGCSTSSTKTEATTSSAQSQSPSAAPTTSETAAETPQGLIVNKTTWADGTWPLTVDEAALGCQGDGLVTITAGGTKYGLNGPAVSQLGLPDATPAIGVPDPNRPGMHLDSRALIAKGLELCGQSPPSTPAGGSNRPAGLVERSTWTDGQWPFTVDTATLMCSAGADGQRVTVTANREMYALNGTAKSQTDLPDFDAIWRDNPNTPGVKVDIGPMLDRGLALCK